MEAKAVYDTEEADEAEHARSWRLVGRVVAVPKRTPQQIEQENFPHGWLPVGFSQLPP